MEEKKKQIAEALAGVGVRDYLLIGFHEIPGVEDQLRGFWAMNFLDIPTFVSNLSALFEGNPEIARLVGMILKFGDIHQRLAEIEGRIQREPGEA